MPLRRDPQQRNHQAFIPSQSKLHASLNPPPNPLLPHFSQYPLTCLVPAVFVPFILKALSSQVLLYLPASIHLAGTTRLLLTRGWQLMASCLELPPRALTAPCLTRCTPQQKFMSWHKGRETSHTEYWEKQTQPREISWIISKVRTE